MNLFFKLLFLTIIGLVVIYYFMKRQEEIPKAPEMAERKVPENSGITLFLCGDIMTGRGIDQAFADAVDPMIYEPYVKNAEEYLRLAQKENGNIKEPIGHDYIWGDALHYWKQFNPHLRISNLETSITDHNEPWPQKGINYRMHPANTKTLTAAKLDFCALANNHVLDWNIPGLTETLVSLENAKIKYAGAGKNASDARHPAVFDTPEGRMLVFSYGHGSSGIPASWEASENEPGINYLSILNADQVQKEMEAYKNENDLVLLSIHWGGNWGYGIPEEQKSFARELIDSGMVDVVHGHSSHHPKGIEVYNNKLIIYGAGDFINDYEGIQGHESYRGELSLMYFPKIEGGSGDLISLVMVPMEIRKFSLHQASLSDQQWMQSTMDRECGKFGHDVSLKEGMLYLKW